MHQTVKAILATALLAAPITSAYAETLIGLTFDGRIVTFDSAAPTTTVSSSLISGLAAGDRLIGLDLRPSNGMLYGVSAGSGNIYTVTTSGLAALVGTLSTAPSGSAFGIDFNPVPDRLRLVSDTDQNLRINVAGGATIVDGTVNGGTYDIIGAAYTNSKVGPAPASTQLFGIDAISDSLLLSSNPNAGTYGLVGALGVGVTTQNGIGFDISGETGAAYLAIDSALYSINLTTGAASFIDTVGAGPLIGLTVAGAVPEPATWAMMIAGFGLAGMAMRRRSNVAVSFA